MCLTLVYFKNTSHKITHKVFGKLIFITNLDGWLSNSIDEFESDQCDGIFQSNNIYGCLRSEIIMPNTLEIHQIRDN